MQLLDAVKAEFAKTFSLRLPVSTAIATVVATISLSGAFTVTAQRAFEQGRPEAVLGLEPSVAFLFILQYGQIGIISFGCWLIFQEQDRGVLRTSFLATPSRDTFLAAKTIVALTVSWLVAVVTVAGSYAVRTFTVGDLALTPGGVEDLRVLMGYVFYWTLLGVFAVSVSILARNGLITLGILVTFTAGLSNFLVQRFPVARFLPDQAGAFLSQPTPPSGTDLSPVLALIVLCCWVVASLVAAGFSIKSWQARG